MLDLLKLLVRPLFRILFAVEYSGLENVPETGPVILAGNHPSYLDPVLVMLPGTRVIKFMAWDALFKVPLLGQLVRAFGAFPVDLRPGHGEAAFRQACQVLEQGEALGIFPEGQRSDQGMMGDLKRGVARLAIETGAPIVPITIGGASRAWPKWKLLPKPAKIIVRYHAPITLDETKRMTERDSREYQNQIMAAVAEQINRSLVPALRSAEAFERWYRQPPSNPRTYEWGPLIAALIAALVAWHRDTLGSHYWQIVLPPLIYYLYLMADLTLIKPSRLAKWLRNSMPIWLILVWHLPLTQALKLPVGAMNLWLVAGVLAAFFQFFWENYFTLQKFVRGLVVVYYFSLALLLQWPDPLGILVAVVSFIAIFSWWFEVRFRWPTVSVMLLLLIIGLVSAPSVNWSLSQYPALAVADLAYLQTFVSAAYDIRSAGEVVCK